MLLITIEILLSRADHEHEHDYDLSRLLKPVSSVEKLRIDRSTGFQPVGPTGILPVESPANCRQDARMPHSQDGCAPIAGELFNTAKPVLGTISGPGIKPVTDATFSDQKSGYAFFV